VGKKNTGLVNKQGAGKLTWAKLFGLILQEISFVEIIQK